MLQEIHIKNIALINEVAISLGAGLNVLSGETGAGKSIVVDSVNLILGARADKDLIQSGEPRAFVEAQLELPGCCRRSCGGIRRQHVDHITGTPQRREKCLPHQRKAGLSHDASRRNRKVRDNTRTKSASGNF